MARRFACSPKRLRYDPTRTLNAEANNLTSETSTGVGRINNMPENGKNVNNEISSPMTVNLPKRNKIMAEIYGEDYYKYILKSEKETFDGAASRVAFLIHLDNAPL